jgi:hypothetical protein
LYWFRTPPGIKVGRQPFDEEARQKIESQNPGITFDWNAIVSTSIPPIPEVEHWRERRRVERAAKVARRVEEAEEEEPANGELARESSAHVEPTFIEPTLLSLPLVEPAIVNKDLEVIADPVCSSDNTQPERPGPGGEPRKRRRRRGGRHRRRPGEPVAGDAAQGEPGDAAEAGELVGPPESRPDTSEE